MSLPLCPTLNFRTLTLNLPQPLQPEPLAPPAHTLKANTALQSVFLATTPKRDDPSTPTVCYDRSVLRFSFALAARHA